MLEPPLELRIEPRALRVLRRRQAARTSGTFSNASWSCGGQLVGREPAQLVDVVCRRGLAAGDARRPVEVQGRLGRRVAAVAVHPDPEEVERLDVETRLLAKLAAEAVERMLALLEEAARECPTRP